MRGLGLLALVVVASSVWCGSVRAGVVVGDQTIEPKADFNAAGTAEAFRFAASGSGQLASASVYVDTGSTATSLVVGVYSDNATHPATLLAQGKLVAPTAAAWNVVTLSGGASLTAGTNYWIALLGTGGTLRFRDRCCSGGSPAEVPAQLNLTSLPAIWSTGARYSDGPASAYASSVDGPLLVVSPPMLSFSALEGGAQPAGQNLAISNGGGGILSWSVTTSVPWLTAGPWSGVDAGAVFVTASSAGLVAGTYDATITVTAAGATGTPQTIPTRLTVTRPDTAPPTVAITAPSAGTTASGTVPVTATAGDDVGVVGVQFKLDGANLGAEVTSLPYAVNWDTRTAADGGHSLTAVARDAAGNSTTSTAVALTVTNGAPPPPSSFLVGDQAIESSTDSNPSGAAEAFKLSAVAGGTLSAFSTYVDVLSTATSITVGLYADANGHPGVLLTQGKLSGPTAGAWNDITVTPVSLTSGGTYWIALLGNGGVVKFRDRCCGNGSPVEASAQTTLTSLPASWSTGASYRDGPASIWGKGASTSGGPPPSQVGQWSDTIAWPSVAVHMALLPTGNVISWDGFADAPNSERLWNPSTGLFTSVPFATNIFCAGHILLPDGRELVVGGHVAAAVGLPNVSIFDPKTNTWSSASPMSVPRWYPTATLLGDGTVFVMGGDSLVEHQSGVPHAFYDSSVPTLPEVYDPVADRWTSLTAAKLNSPWYPFLFQLSDGRILDAGPDTVTRTITPGTWTWQNLNAPSPFDGMSAVMYRPDKVMKAGSWADPDFKGALVYSSSARTAVLDMTHGAPSWRETAPMNYPRSYENLTLLPDGTTFASGGMSTSDGVDLSQAVLPAELWDPAGETWTTMASMSVGREYHSTALLLPDGRVLMAGGGQLPGSSATNQYNAQIYSPPYLFKGARPTIASAPSLVQYGSTFQVTTPDAAGIASVSLIRTPAVTHDFDMNQRFVPLSFTQGSGVLNVGAPANGNVAPPGYYMLFIVNTSGVPSVASFVRFPAPYEDTVPPSAPGTASAAGGVGAISVSWGAASDNVAVDHYEVYRSTTIGFTPSVANRIATPVGTSYLDGGLPVGTYFYRVKAVDRAGNLSPASNEATSSATADTTPPVVSLTAPPPGASVSGAVSVSATATDNVGVVGVQFRVDGANIGSEIATSPYGTLWDSTTVTNGTHTLSAVARDASGNTRTSTDVIVNVGNSAPPVLTVLLGDQAVEPKIDGNAGGSAEAFSTVATAAGSVKQLTFYVDSSSVASSVIVGLYADNGGHPGTLLSQSTVSAPALGAWATVSVSAAAVTAGSTYWIALLSPSGAGTVKFRNKCCGGGSPAEASSSTTLTTLPATWSSGAPYKDGPLSAYGSG